MEPIMRTEHVSRVFQTPAQKVVALDDININIYPGELTLLRGRSGSGKTTLLNSLSALDRPTGGNIWLGDRNIAQMRDGERDALRRKEMGFVFQAVALFSQMTAYENVEFALRLAGVPRKQYAQRTKEALQAVGLGKRMLHLPAEMSGGEQQRVAIARGLVTEPRIIFADEPTAEVDTTMAFRIMNLFRSLAKETNMTFVITTHDPQMMELADHIYTLQDGHVIDEMRRTHGEVTAQ